jgi:serine protease Do
MSEAPAAKLWRRSLPVAGTAMAFIAGIAIAPNMPSHQASAQEIVVAPPSGAPLSFADLIEHVRPAVVSISVRQSPDAATAPAIEGLPPGFEEYFRGRPGRPGPAPTALGSGFFIDERGTVVTNHHVVEGAEEIRVRTSDGRELPAELVGSDELTDIAVLRVTGGGRFPFVRFDNASHVRVGDWVVAVGNPFGLDGTATAGIVSAIGRRDAGSTAYVDYMQIDAPINRGNSGGPTFDLQGNVIGVNSAIFSPTGGNVGIGFAIPSDVASNVVRQLLDGGRVSRGWLGVSIQPLDEDIARSLGLADAKGALVANVVPDSPAAQGGVLQGDVILRFNGELVEDSRDLTRRVGAAPIGRPSRVEVLRSGARRSLSIRLAERPAEQALASNRETPDQQPDAPGVAQASLGLNVRPMSDADRQRLELGSSESGLVVTSVEPGSDLANKGVRPGDVILQADYRPVRNAADLTTAVEAARRAGRPILLQVDGRAGRRYVAAELGQG